MYDAPDELLRAIRAGEDSYLECKEVVWRGSQVRFSGESESGPLAFAKYLTCFANSDGGVIALGVTDAGDVVGVDRARVDALQRFIADAARNNCEPPLDHLILVDNMLLPGTAGKEALVLKVEVRAARHNVHAPRGRRPYHPVLSTCSQMSMEQQARLLERRGAMVSFDERPWPSAPLDCLDTNLFSDYYERRFEHPIADAPSPLSRLLQNLRLVGVDELGTPRPTTLGLLLFCADPHEYLRGAWVDVVVYSGTHPDADQQRDSKRITGTVWQQIQRTLDYLRLSPFVPVAAEKDGTGRKDLPAYSMRALQEAVVNALVHRDYQLAGSQVIVRIFADRIEVTSPGGLHNTLQPEDLFAGCQPYRRNQLLAGFLRDFTSPITGRAYMESRGEGFLMMVRETERLTGHPPLLRQIGDAVFLTIFAATSDQRRHVDGSG